MGYYEGRPDYYRGTMKDISKEYWYLYVISIIWLVIGFLMTVNFMESLEDPKPNILFFLLIGAAILPLCSTFWLCAKTETKRHRAALDAIKEWENQPEKKEQKRKEVNNIQLFHHAGAILGGLYAIRRDTTYKQLESLLFNEADVLIIELDCEQKEKLVNGESIEISMGEDSLRLDGDVKTSASKLYVNI